MYGTVSKQQGTTSTSTLLLSTQLTLHVVFPQKVIRLVLIALRTLKYIITYSVILFKCGFCSKRKYHEFAHKKVFRQHLSSDQMDRFASALCCLMPHKNDPRSSAIILMS